MKPAYILALGLSLGTSMAYRVHNISVGDAGLDFAPNSITASVGDYVQFTFLTGTHAVAQAGYDSPCTPYSGSTEGAGNNGIYSGLIVPYKNYFPTYTIRINNTDPIWFYCPESYHCQSGMVGVINPGNGQSLSDFTNLAAQQSRNNAPVVVSGNTTIGAPVDEPSNASVTSVASTSTSVASAASGIATSATSSSAAAASSSVSAGSVNVAGGAILITALAAGLRLFA
ncbi:Cupredoxin [Lipomyces chichibuensis]|uniref:Cupredoxin n=1 Tax=Lipomyces chichibuensis TaxID=1546026 RepID=UPI00334375E1